MSPSTATVRRPAASATRCSSAGAHRDRVRVPGVVDQHAAAGERQLLVPPLGELDLEPRRASSRPSACAVASAVSAFAARCRAVKSTSSVAERASRARAVEGLELDVLADPDDLEVVALDREVRGDDGDPAGGERVDQLALRPDDAVEVADLLQVHGADVRDHADVRARERAELGDLAEAAHRELEDAELGVGLDAADRQRDADLGVVAPLGGDRAPLRRADRGEDVLRRGLPHRAGDRDEAGGAAVAHAAGERGERGEGVVGDERRRGAAGERVLDEVGAAADGDEEVALLDPPRVGLEAGDLRRPGRGLERAGRELARPRRARAGSCGGLQRAQRFACHLGSSNGRSRLRDLLPALVPLAGDHDDVARPGQLDRALDRRARGRARPPARRRIPARISSMIACGSSLRGLSEVTIATSASSVAIRPISGRLPRSRSPPQPKTQITRPVGQLARGAEDVLERARLVRVVDDHREGLSLVDRLEPAGDAGDRGDPACDRVVGEAEQARRRDRRRARSRG